MDTRDVRQFKNATVNVVGECDGENKEGQQDLKRGKREKHETEAKGVRRVEPDYGVAANHLGG